MPSLGSPAPEVRALFAEPPGRVLAAVTPSGVDRLAAEAAASGVEFRRLGRFGGARIRIGREAQSAWDVDLALSDAVARHSGALEASLRGADRRGGGVNGDPEAGVDLVKPREACGVIGVYLPGGPVAHLSYLGLYALQHRGQESAGIAVSDGTHITVVKDMGLVASAFDDRVLAGLEGGPGDRAHPLLHHWLELVARRAAVLPRAGGNRVRLGAQRQSHQHG